MIQTMTCVWWLILLMSIAATCWFGWQAYIESKEHEGFALAVLIGMACLMAGFAVLAAATVCALQLAGAA